MNTITEDTIELVAKFEGLKLRAYKDSIGVWTIGYGNTYYEDGSKIKEGDTITQDRANMLFKLTLDNFSKNVNKLLKITLTENQYSAIISLAYNIGLGNFGKSTLLKNINAGVDITTLKSNWICFDRAGGQELNALKNRRIAEFAHFIKNLN